MLSQFTFSNFKSFRDEVTLDFTPARIQEHNNSLITDSNDDETFLPVAALYGPNGGGKSTVLEALIYLRDFIMRPIVLLSGTSDEKFIAKDENFLNAIKMNDKCFKFDSHCKDKPNCFDILFRQNNIEYKYQLQLLHGEIIEENLYARETSSSEPLIIFERSIDDCYLGPVLDGVAADKIKNTMSLLSYIFINYDIEMVGNAISWFGRMYYFNYNAALADRKIPVLSDQKYKKLFLNMLNEMDIDISDYRIERGDDKSIKDIFVMHTIPEGNTEISFKEESSGTQKMFSLIPRMVEGLLNGNLIIADEMDAKLHPKLLEYIIRLFTNNEINKRGAQLLLTSHDLTTMNSGIFRRDEIWFCALDAEHNSNLYSLVSFKKSDGTKTRNDESYNKRYLEGRYGADPYLKRILNWEELYE